MSQVKEIGLTIPYDSGFTHVLFNLLAQGVIKIEVAYSGAGDSGAIDEVALVLRDGPTCLPTSELSNLIENYVYKNLLDDLDDWYNNDGGGGHLIIETADASYVCDHYVNVVNQLNTEHTGKFGDK